MTTRTGGEIGGTILSLMIDIGLMTDIIFIFSRLIDFMISSILLFN